MKKMNIGTMRNPASMGLIVFAFLLLTFPATSSSQTLPERVNDYIGAWMKMGRFSGSLLIAKDGQFLVSKGYGMANHEHDVPNTPQTKFRLGSVTKQFTAAAVMQLQERGKLNVADTLAQYIPDYPSGDRITIHHLLTHTSGIVEVTRLPEFRQYLLLPTTVEKTISLFKDKPLEFPPGEQFRYSNSGYLLLGFIIEKVSGQTYEEFLKGNIFGPLNMVNSGYDHPSAILKNRASGYNLAMEGLINGPYNNMTAPHAGGALYSTVEDMFLWDRALYTEKILKKSSLDRMFTPFKGNYGYGWIIDSIFGHKRIQHGGSIVGGFQSHIARYVDDDVLIVFLCNQQPTNARKISEDLAAIVFGQPYKLPTEDDLRGRDEKKDIR
jgi:CubicO group peptidase (beta-lactamase class C family)